MKFLFALNKACELMSGWVLEFIFCKLFLGNSYSQSKAFADAWVFSLEKDPSLKKKSYFFRSMLLNRVVGYGESLSTAREFAQIAQEKFEWVRKTDRGDILSGLYCRAFAERMASLKLSGVSDVKAVPRASRFANLVEERCHLFKEILPQACVFAELVMCGIDLNVAEGVSRRYVQIFRKNEWRISSWRERACANKVALETACSEYDIVLSKNNE